LGSVEVDRLSVCSILIRPLECSGLILHYNYVVSLLSDLFGIQIRGGCNCAGPYGARLLQIDTNTRALYRVVLEKGFEGNNFNSKSHITYAAPTKLYTAAQLLLSSFNYTATHSSYNTHYNF
jgi:hypothetical protein